MGIGDMIRTAAKFAMLTALIALCGGLAGCSDGIEVNSKLFDALNIGSSGLSREPQMSERAGLVIPPPMPSLPEPGSGRSVTDAVNAQLPKDPEAVAVQSEEAKKKKLAEACAQARIRRDEAEQAKVCPGLFGKMLGVNQAN